MVNGRCPSVPLVKKTIARRAPETAVMSSSPASRAPRSKRHRAEGGAWRLCRTKRSRVSPKSASRTGFSAAETALIRPAFVTSP